MGACLCAYMLLKAVVCGHKFWCMPPCHAPRGMYCCCMDTPQIIAPRGRHPCAPTSRACASSPVPSCRQKNAPAPAVPACTHPSLAQAAVACLELRLRAPQHEPAWRVVVSLPSGHEHGEENVDVYREHVSGQAEQEQVRLPGWASEWPRFVPGALALTTRTRACACTHTPCTHALTHSARTYACAHPHRSPCASSTALRRRLASRPQGRRCMGGRCWAPTSRCSRCSSAGWLRAATTSRECAWRGSTCTPSARMQRCKRAFSAFSRFVLVMLAALGMHTEPGLTQRTQGARQWLPRLPQPLHAGTAMISPRCLRMRCAGSGRRARQQVRAVRFSHTPWKPRLLPLWAWLCLALLR